MTRPILGHAVIINNVVDEMPGSMEDVKALKTTYEKVGFNVQVHTRCTAQVNLRSGYPSYLKVHSTNALMGRNTILRIYLHYKG